MFAIHRNFSLSTGIKGTTIAVVNTGVNIFVVYHKTLVVEKRGRTVTLRNGGWDTVSTRHVINNCLSEICSSECYLFRKRGETFLTQNGIVKLFVSGMKIKVFHRKTFISPPVLQLVAGGAK